MPKIKNYRRIAGSEVMDQYKADPEIRHQLTTRRHNRPLAIRLLVMFVQVGDLAWVEDMISRKVPIDGKWQNITPLYHACCWRQTKMVELLLDQGASVNLVSRDGQTPLIAAVIEEEIDLVKLLLSKGARCNVKDSLGRTALFYACEGDDSEIFKVLLEHGAEVNVVDKQGLAPLASAARYGKANIVETLIERGAALQDRNKQGIKGLFSAVIASNKHVAELLLEKGVDVNERLNGVAPLHVALGVPSPSADNEDRIIGLDMVKLLLDYGADPLAIFDDLNKSAINMAASGSSIEVMKLLLDNGVGVNEISAPGTSPLFEACFAGRVDMASFLIDQRASIEMENRNGMTCLFYAVLVGVVDLVKFLIEKGANVNVNSKNGATPLEIAVLRSDLPTVQVLVDAGADVNAKVRGNNNILELASRTNAAFSSEWDQDRASIVDVLRGHGARYPEELDDSRQWTALVSEETIRAARTGDLKESLQLLEEFKEDEAKFGTASIVLKCAAQRKNFDICKQILDKYPRVNTEQAFVAAAENSDKDLIELLMEKESQCAGKAWPLPFAAGFEASAREGKLRIFELLRKNSKILREDLELGNSLLAIASVNGHWKYAERLFELGFGQNSGKLNWAGMRALKQAVKEGNKPMINALLRKASVTEDDEDGTEDTILMLAISDEDRYLAKLLLNRGADPDFSTRGRVTPLMKASRLGDTDMVKLLLFRGAEVNLRDEKDKSALDYANARKRFKIIELLKASGAKDN
jgi:ankyrin repeat protein